MAHDTLVVIERIGWGIWYLATYISAAFAATYVRRRDVRSQNDLLARCRAIYMLATRAHREGHDHLVADHLRQIRSLEGVWRKGRARSARFRTAILGALVGGLAYFTVAMGFWAALICGNEVSIASCIRESGFLAAVAPWLLALGLAHGLAHYIETPVVYGIDNCGDRLEALINAPRDVGPALDVGPVYPSFDGLTPREIFGLPPGFTRSQLNSARRRIASKVHPDRWRHAGPGAIAAAEDAMKRINAAFELLKNERGN